MLIREAFLADKEYRQLFADLKNVLGTRALPFVACGLCDGAADALMASLFTSLSGNGAMLCILPEEKECNRFKGKLHREHRKKRCGVKQNCHAHDDTASYAVKKG